MNECFVLIILSLHFAKNNGQNARKPDFLFIMMAINTSPTKSGGNVCLVISVHLKTDHVEGKDDVEVALEALLDLVGKHERRS